VQGCSEIKPDAAHAEGDINSTKIVVLVAAGNLLHVLVCDREDDVCAGGHVSRSVERTRTKKGRHEESVTP
jgi:hypothetical protein